MPRKKRKLIYKYRLSTMVWAIITTAVVVALIVAVILSVAMNDGGDDSLTISTSDLSDTAAPRVEVVEEKNTELKKGTYFLLDNVADGQKVALNLETKDTLELPNLTGYSVKNFRDINPDYLILEKDGQLFSYNVKKQELNSQAIVSAGDFELLIADSSISEPDKFLVEQYKYSEANFKSGMVWELNYDSVVTYIFDAKKHETTIVRNAEYGACHKLDSKYNRYYVWSCGEGVGNVLPLLTVDLATGATQDVLDSQVFHDNIIDSRLLDSMYRVSYYDGYFVSTSSVKDNMGQVAVVDARTKDIIVRKYEFASDALAQFNSIAVGASKQFIFNDDDNSFIFIDSNNVLMLKTNDGKIVTVNHVPSNNIHSVYTYVSDGKLYFMNTDGETKLNILDVKSSEIESQIPVNAVSSFGYWKL